MNNNRIKLWLDDQRPCPFIGGAWKTALNYEEAIQLLTNSEGVDECWLDHDLAEDHYRANMDPGYISPNKSGLDVVRWMSQNGKMPEAQKDTIPNIRVHSLNPVGSKNIAQAIVDYYRYPETIHYSRFQFSYLKILATLKTDFDKQLKIGKDS